jgi:sulfatase modifying factor 1
MQSHRKYLQSSRIYFHIFLLSSLATLTGGCSLFGIKRDDKGSFKSYTAVEWRMDQPEGMEFIPAGHCLVGTTDKDIFGKDFPNKQVTLSPFLIDATQVTNAHYRNFINTILETAKERKAQTDAGNETGDGGDAGDDQTLDQGDSQDQQGGGENEEKEKDAYDEYNEMYKVIYGVDLTPEGVMENLYPDTTVWLNDFGNTTMADRILNNYFDHEAFNNYPVVGVTWKNANYYCYCQTVYLNKYRKEKGEPTYPAGYTLPSKYQWEYAARGGKELAKYPWGGPYIRDGEGNLQANFKSGKGDYSESGYTYTCPVDAFPPNEFGLYGMSGNVAEWTSDAYDPASTSRVYDLDPVYMDGKQPMKVVKGGSWKDISRFLQVGIDDYEHEDSARSYIGFRCVMPYIGPQNPTVMRHP